MNIYFTHPTIAALKLFYLIVTSHLKIVFLDGHSFLSSR
jgi:hypothetical protein